MGYKQLDFQKRCQIYGLWRAGYNQTEIANEIGVHKSTISRELTRNIVFVRTALGSWQHKHNYAQTYAEKRHKDKNKRIKFTKEVETFVRDKLQQDWSPDQNLHLRHQHKKYRKRYGSPARTGPIKNRIFIDERPAVVNEKTG